MATACPACGSADIRKLSELWNEFRSGTGTSVARIEAAIAAQLAAAPMPGDPREALRELLVRELAPPEKKYDLPVGGSCLQMSAGMIMLLGGLVMVILAGLRIARYHLGIKQIFVIVAGGLAISVVGYAIGRIGYPRATYRQYEERLAAWQRSDRCMQCGHHFAADAQP